MMLPPETFIVRAQSQAEGPAGHSFSEYVSDVGDRLRVYQTDPFPIAYELERSQQPGRVEVHFHRDLPYFIIRGWTPDRLAQVVYQVADPDLLQVETMRRLAAEAVPGVEAIREIDRTQPHLDPATPRACRSFRAS
jgi:hypothetical protein